MKKRFTLLIAMVLLLTAMATNVFASLANNNSEVSPKEWQEWFDGLSKEEQLSVNYVPASLQQLSFTDRDIEWLNWYNSLSKEGQLSVNYVPESVQQISFTDEDIEWLKWYGSLSEEEKLAVNYVPSQVYKVLSDIKVPKAPLDSLSLKEDNNKKANKPARKAGNNAKTGIAGISGIAGILASASVFYVASKRD